jgi:uncharacterized membrane protein
MSSTSIKTHTLSALLGAAALAVAASATFAADMKDGMKDMPKPMTDMAKPASEKCFGVAKAAKNDCAAGAHSCAGQATKDFDKTSYVLLPAGVCGKLAGGNLAAMTK